MIKRILIGLFIGFTILVLSSLFLSYKIVRDTNTKSLSFNLTQSIKSCSTLDNTVISKKNQKPNFIVISEPSVEVTFDWMLKVLSNIKEKFKAITLNYGVISEIYINISEAKRAYLSLWDVPVTDTVRLQYKVENPPQDLQIQDISLMLPNSFHQNISYELSCRSTSKNRELIVFRKLSAKIHTHNYEEPPISLLPRACLFNTGEVVVRIYDKRDMKYYLNQLKSSEFRAVLWQPGFNTINKEPLNLYLSKISYLPGQTIKIHAHAIDPSISASLEILSLGKNAKSWKKLDNITLETQTITPYSYRDGLNWSVTSSVKLASDAPYGYYAAVLRQGKTQATYPFIIRPKKGDSTPIAIIAATNTWQAYNDWGKGSFYVNEIGKNCLATDYARLISSQRPINQDPFHEAQPGDHLISAELLIVKWLEKSEHNYVVYSEDDLNEDPSILKKHKIVLLPSHPEYYTKAMLNAIEQHIQGGGNILNLGGNALYYKIAMKGYQLEKHENGRVFDLSDDFGGFWSMHHARSSSSILGVEYDARDYNTFQPYTVKAADHPIFKGTSLKNGDLIAPKGSGLEMDVRNSFTPPNAILLAKGTNPKGYGADMVFIELPSGAKVFSAGSTSFAYGMSNDKKVQMLLDNVVKLMTER